MGRPGTSVWAEVEETLVRSVPRTNGEAYREARSCTFPCSHLGMDGNYEVRVQSLFRIIRSGRMSACTRPSAAALGQDDKPVLRPTTLIGARTRPPLPDPDSEQ